MRLHLAVFWLTAVSLGATGARVSAQTPGEVQITVLRTERKPVVRYWATVARTLPESLFTFRPVASVRTFAELFAHVADAEFAMCAGLRSDAPRPPSLEKAKLSPSELRRALTESLEYCDTAYARVQDRALSDTVDFFGTPSARLFVMAHDIAHLNEHYGNVVTYLRLLGLTPPSSQP
ncbi:MAG: DinB family protein [Gemmatimonadaceae bacterium]